MDILKDLLQDDDSEKAHNTPVTVDNHSSDGTGDALDSALPVDESGEEYNVVVEKGVARRGKGKGSRRGNANLPPTTELIQEAEAIELSAELNVLLEQARNIVADALNQPNAQAIIDAAIKIALNKTRVSEIIAQLERLYATAYADAYREIRRLALASESQILAQAAAAPIMEARRTASSVWRDLENLSWLLKARAEIVLSDQKGPGAS